LGHDAGPIAPHDFWRAWTFEPGIILIVVLAALLYGEVRGKARERLPANLSALWVRESEVSAVQKGYAPHGRYAL
jgi:hypothetical protein